MPRWPKKVASPANPVEEVAPPAIDPVDDNRRLSSNEPTALEKAMEMLIISNANTQVLLGKIDDTMNKVVDGIQKINDTAKNSVDHQIDLDEMRKSKPFKLKMIYQIDQRTIDLGDGIYEFENTGRSFNSREEAMEFGNKSFGPQGFRIVTVEMPMSQV